MKWALVTNSESTMSLAVWTSSQVDDGAGGTYTKFNSSIDQVLKPAGTISDIIVYDGVEQYASNATHTLVSVPDTAIIGDEGYL